MMNRSSGAAPRNGLYGRIAEDILLLTAGLGTGAGLMYLCDPKRGRARRGRLVAEVSGLIRRDEGKITNRAKDLLNRVGGLATEAVSALIEEGPVADEVLVQRVRSRMGHIVSKPHEIQVRVHSGVVTLEGMVTHAERRRVRENVKSIHGVKSLDDHLKTRFRLDPGLLMGIAAGLAWIGKAGSHRTRPAASQAD